MQREENALRHHFFIKAPDGRVLIITEGFEQWATSNQQEQPASEVCA
jgi:hypothetical protein